MGKIIDYTPAPTVEKFLQDYLPGELFYSFIDGPVGSAKTTGSLFKIPYMASLQEPSPVDGIRRSRVVVVRNTFTQLRDTTIPSWNTWFKDGEAGEWKATKNTFILKFDDVECEVMFRALDTAADVSRVLSLEVTFAVLDEFVQIPAEIVEALSGRCGRYPAKIDGGATNWGMWGSSNPGEEETWWHDFLITKRPENVAYFHQPSGMSPDAENIENLPKGYYVNLAKGKSDSWVHQFIYAEWGFSTAGTPVISTFSRKLHVSDVPLQASGNSPIIIGYDPGRISAFIFGQLTIFGQLQILKELILHGYGTRRALDERLIPFLKAHFAGLDVVISPDPAAGQWSQSEETSVLQVLKERKYQSHWTVAVDQDNTRNLLQPRIDAIDYFTTRLVSGGPAMLIDPSCKRLIRAAQSGWRYELTKSGGNEKPKPEKNESSHPGDAWGYLCRYASTNDVRYKPRQAVGRYRTFGNSYVLR